MHPLDHADFRLDWAKKRLAELKVVDAAYIDEEIEFIAKSASVSMNPQTGNPQIRYPNKPGHLIPVSFPILVGEVAYNLRASLDYLVHRLAELDSGSEQKNTQFPVADTPESFRGNRNRFLKGVNDAHAAAIERLQPYNGVDWTKWLVTVSNPDKHRHLIASARQGYFRIRYGLTPDRPDPADRTGGCLVMLLTLTDNVTNQPMYVEVELTLLVTFDGRLPVINTLEQIALKVGDTLAYFKPEF